MKWVFKHAERVGAARLVIVGEREFADGNVTVKDLAARTEALVKADELV